MTALKLQRQVKTYSHEEHFAQVTSGFLKYLSEGELPDWEVPGMITKYFTTTSALKIAKGNK